MILHWHLVAKSNAMERPNPLDAPVINTFRFWNSFIVFFDDDDDDEKSEKRFIFLVIIWLWECAVGRSVTRYDGAFKNGGIVVTEVRKNTNRWLDDDAWNAWHVVAADITNIIIKCNTNNNEIDRILLVLVVEKWNVDNRIERNLCSMEYGVWKLFCAPYRAV